MVQDSCRRLIHIKALQVFSRRGVNEEEKAEAPVSRDALPDVASRCVQGMQRQGDGAGAVPCHVRSGSSPPLRPGSAGIRAASMMSWSPLRDRCCAEAGLPCGEHLTARAPLAYPARPQHDRGSCQAAQLACSNAGTSPGKRCYQLQRQRRRRRHHPAAHDKCQWDKSRMHGAIVRIEVELLAQHRASTCAGRHNSSQLADSRPRCRSGQSSDCQHFGVTKSRSNGKNGA